MKFKQILLDIEKLVGKPLQAINPKTAPIYITKFDHDVKSYYVSNYPNELENSRPFTELEAIWNELVYKGFCNVDQALYGSGSSRNQPETVFAHLPYIQHFRFKGKKHIFLRSTHVHELGSLSELTGDDLSILLSKIDNYLSLSNQSISVQQNEILNKLKTILNRVDSEPSHTSISNNLNSLIKSLTNLENKVNNSIVTLKNELYQISENDAPYDRLIEIKSVEDIIEDEIFTGIENEVEDFQNDIDDDISLSISEKSKHQEHNKDGLRIRHITPVLSLIYDRLSFEEIELQPDFQRKDRIWSMEKRSKLIESILMGLPLPAFYFAEKKNGNWIVVDGLQRITTVFDFMKDRFKLADLKSLNDDYNGTYFSELSRLDKRKIREYQITAHVIDDESDKDGLIVELFHRINTYGVKLSNQEIRSAMYQGSSVTFLRYLSSSSEFVESTNNKVSPQRQKDMELCLSALSYIALGYKNFDYSTYNEFLSSAMKQINKHVIHIKNKDGLDDGKAHISKDSDELFFQLERKFKQGLNFAYKIFEGTAFRKSLIVGKSAPISKPLFEVVVATFANLTEQQMDKISKNIDKFIKEFSQAIDSDSDSFADWDSDKYQEENRGFMYSITASTGKRVTILYRFDTFINILKKTTGIEVDIKPVLGKHNDK
ncbi:DUF262 domain-containing protein [Providencia burhodogranariea]|uniref:GmrSD restriction endonucleases N-terminal domain-containing protein n=1 Tax=Providencia burhodogranariea DSM 19968 TaxID=1141662 RepID=K8X7Z4_9GAMM|nr:DUF262 domain-containing protein [Providencia burhodogranariea]EKT64540.1 hypothetical protein OOA_02047 [Providencia burhodogranariea DSM 19968]